MTLVQLITPNLNIQYVGGWCQRASENSVGQNNVYASAYKAWLANVQHKENPPKGLYVPIYLSMPNGPKDAQGLQQGDVAWSCPDGTVAAAALSGTHTGLYKYPSLQAYISDYAKNNGGATYLGWGEYVGRLQVVKEVNVEQKITFEEAQDLSQTVLLRPEPVTREWFNSSAEKNMTFIQVYRIWKDSQEAKNARFKVWDYDKLKQRLTVDSAGAVDKLEQIRAIVG